MIEVLKSSNHFYIVMELITNGELFDKIVQEKRFDEKNARRYFQQLIDGLSYCHKKGIAHRDLKPENLLIGDKDILKISDFGLSGLTKNNTMLSTICGKKKKLFFFF
jgi:5'-AMP-activated protein kinase, catalytic alpha subunit